MLIKQDMATTQESNVLQNGHSKNGTTSHKAELSNLMPVPANAPMAVTGNYRCYTEQLSVETLIEVPSFNDITEAVRKIVAVSGVTMGSVTIYSRHTTASIIINEHEPLLLNDMCERLTRLFPKDEYYSHNDFDIRTHNMNPGETPNGHSHCQHLLLSTSETVPVVDGQMMLGRWQSIFLVELDRPLPRNVVVVVSGI